MSRIDDLPEETLMLCASHLGSEDLKNAALVSRRFETFFGLALYRKIYWNFGDLFDQETEDYLNTHCSDYTYAKYGHDLAYVLSHYPAVIPRIQVLFIDCNLCEYCEDAPYFSDSWYCNCAQVTTSLWTKFLSLKELHLTDMWQYYCMGLPSLPTLESLLLQGTGQGPDMEGKGLELGRFLRQGLHHPKLRQLKIFGSNHVKIFLATGHLDRLETCLCSTSLTTLTMDRVRIDEMTLKALFRQFSNLRTLNFEKWYPEYDEDREASSPDCSWKQLHQALLETKVSLEGLSIKPQGDLEITDRTLFGPLREYERLEETCH